MFKHKQTKITPAVPKDKLGIYIHIPFCRSKCDYCDFYSLSGRENRMDDYQKALLAHLKETAPLAKGVPVDTIYFGGGTPSYYGEKRLKQLLHTVQKLYTVEQDAEITTEANPDSVDARMLTHLRRAGFNRLSLGYQSACPAELTAIHRIHTREEADAAVQAARKAKFKNLSLDLIYGLPGQTMDSWQQSVEHILTLEPEHLSCYGLKVERLAKAGYEQYEISNFSKPGLPSRHNLRYWLTRPYIGFGPGAHSDFGGRRYSFVRDLDAYIAGVLHGGSLLDSDEVIPDKERSGEYLMLRLRTAQGIEEWEYRRKFFMDFDPIRQRLIGDLLERQEQAALRDLLPRVREEFSGRQK